MEKRLRRITIFALRCISLISLLSLVIWFPLLFIGRENKHHFSQVEFPLRGIQDVVVDSNDRVYVGIVDYGRIQVYDRTGRFLYGFFSRQHRPNAKMGFADDGSLLVTATDEILVYTVQGNHLATRAGGGELRRQWKQGRSWTRDSAGREFQIRHPVLNPTIVTVAPNGSEQIFLAMPFYLWPFVAPIPCLISIAITQIASRILSRRPPGEAVEIVDFPQSK